MNRFKGKVAIVTGASSGIGAKVAEDLVQAGLKVVGIARRLDRLQALENNLNTKGNTGIFYPKQVDVIDTTKLEQTIDLVQKELGPIHILVNSAGVYIHEKFTEGMIESWKKTFDTNVLSGCVATKEVIKDMKKNNTAGHIIFLSSIAGHRLVAGSIGMYGPSKYAITALTETWRRELANEKINIKITTISPCLVDTEMNSSLKGDFLNNLPFINPEDISQGIIYVLSTPPHVQVEELTIKAVGVPF